MLDKLEQKYKVEISRLVPVKQLSSSFQDLLIDQAEIVMIPSGSSLIEQDEQSDSLFYLLSGEIELSFDKEIIKTISAGTPQSSLAINQNFPYAVDAKSRVVILGVDRLFVEKLVLLESSFDSSSFAGDKTSTNAAWMTQLISSDVFNQIPLINVYKIFSKLKKISAEKDEPITMQHKVGTYFYIIRDGRCIVTKENEITREKTLVSELGVGDSFGEDALFVTEKKRGTSVTMSSDGTLIRLSQKDYHDLLTLTNETVEELGFEQALSQVQEGSKWLDIRYAEEFSQAHLKESQNIPLDQLQQKLAGLSKLEPYVVYCDTGHRSVVATRLLNEHGFQASCLEGGVIRYSNDADLNENWLETYAEKATSEKATSEKAMDMSLLADDSNKIVSLVNDDSDLRYVSDPVVKQIQSVDHRIKELKTMFEPTSYLLEEEQPIADLGILVEARKKIDHMESMPRKDLLEDESDEAKGELGLLRKQLENARTHIQQERQRVSNSNDKEYSEQKELTLRHVADELETIKHRLREQEANEEIRRNNYEQELSTEREKMREQLALFSSGLELQKSRTMEVEQVRQLAALETQQVIEKFKDVHKQYRLRQQKKLQVVREQLQRQAKHVIEKARKAEAGKAQALADLQAMRAQLDELKKKQSGRDAGVDIPLLLDVESVRSDVEKSNDMMSGNGLQPTQGLSADLLDQVRKDEDSIRHELISWFTSNDQFKLVHQELSVEQRASLERVKKIAHEALEQAFDGKRPRSDGSDDQYLKNY